MNNKTKNNALWLTVFFAGVGLVSTSFAFDEGAEDLRERSLNNSRRIVSEPLFSTASYKKIEAL